MLRVNVAFVAAWLMLNGISSLSTDALSLSVGDNSPYPVETCNYTQSTDPREAYNNMIDSIRNLLTDNELGPIHGIPRLADPNSVQANRRFLQLNLINTNGDSVTVALNTTTLYVVGYRRRDEFLYFSDAPQGAANLFPELPRHESLKFGSSYVELERQAKAGRSTIPLGFAPYEQAIVALQGRFSNKDVANAFIVIIQMISEAIRFRYIQRYVANIIAGEPREPSATMLDLETSWGSFSERYQRSVSGTLVPEVTIADPRHDGEILHVDTVSVLLKAIGILYYVCNNIHPNANQFSLISTTPLHIDGGGTNCTNISEPIIRLPVEKGAGHMEGAGDICKNIGEPTVRIAGRDGLCADVKGGFYNNGNPIILSTCKSNEDVNQLWTLKADGTIRSNGKCLTTYGYTPGDYIMIYDCSSAVPDATKWHIRENGTIINPRSKLVLSGNQHSTTLTAEVDVYATSQGWVVANNTQPTLIPIINNEKMCLQSYGYNLLVYCVECEKGQGRQLFAVYPDGSIRPDNRRDHCLTANSTTVFAPTTIVYGNECNGGAEQRWSFNRDYSITNLGTGIAMDAQHNEYALATLTPVVDIPRDSQQWHTWFL